MSQTKIKNYPSEDAWREEGKRLFGEDTNDWRFVCPSCGHVASVKEWKDLGAPEGCVAFSCVGRFMDKCENAFQEGKGPCNYAGGGLFRINPVHIEGHEGNFFDFERKESNKNR